MILLLFILQLLLISTESTLHGTHQYENTKQNLKIVIEEIVQEMNERAKCIVFVTDSVYKSMTSIKDISSSLNVSKYEIMLRDNEQFLKPRRQIKKILIDSKKIGCNAYVMIIANGFLAAEFLQYTESERLIDTRGLFLLLYDTRLFQSNLHYLWNRIINVVFIRRYNAYRHRSGEKPFKERIDLNTVYFPSHKTRTAMKYLDTWYQGKLHYGTDYFKEKTTNLQNKQLLIAVFEHIPAVTEKSRPYYEKRPDNSIKALGIEYELMQVISEAMNFTPKYYMPYNIASEKWGDGGKNQNHTGLIGEVLQGKAAFYIGDLHYTLDHINYFDLSIPYNTECLTFLTPESLTENSWKLLILPFKKYKWIFSLFLEYTLGSVSYKKYISLYKSQMHSQDGISIQTQMKGLYLFTKLENSILYTYSMLFQVSLPNLPSPWAVRILIGWWWTYSILVTVAYRASMTATLANPVARVTIDTLEQLAKSSIDIGGWNKESKNFFLISSDLNSQKIGNKFQLINNENEAIKKVANGSFCYYESSYLLRHARVKRQVLEKEQNENQTARSVLLKYNLHIMEECVVNMPIAIGMDKNSPLKSNVDILMRRIIEIGLIEKWLSEVMEWSKIMETRQEKESEKALVNMHKLQGAFIAVVVGYLLASIILIAEIIHWKYIVLRDPEFDKYCLDTFYSNNNPKIQINRFKFVH
ncbi:uncharacterized protein LOC108626469 [Ceratina calcarata]|uniref:Uncharacterized protein LOC108626469 n=1 Tax=Ceratina calcarata TaxID=156304 RepID=A0AAJ7WBU1_9HYME|nr:uncharacterized protein LOC108626469 [Ceratina calcarata]